MAELNKDVLNWLADQRSRVDQVVSGCMTAEGQERAFNDLTEMAGEFIDLAKRLLVMANLAANAAVCLRGDPPSGEDSSAQAT